MTEDGRTRYIVEIDTQDAEPFLRDMVNFPRSEVTEMTPEQEVLLFGQEQYSVKYNKDEAEREEWSAELADLRNIVVDLRFSYESGDSVVKDRFTQLYENVRKRLNKRDVIAGRTKIRTLDSFIEDTLVLFETSVEGYAKYKKRPGGVPLNKRNKAFGYKREDGLLTPREVRMLAIKLKLPQNETATAALIQSEGDIGVIEASRIAQRNLESHLAPLPLVINKNRI